MDDKFNKTIDNPNILLLTQSDSNKLNVATFNMNTLEAFNYYFQIIPANTDELKQEVYKLRYQVYCLEKKFENPETHINSLECDEYDKRSIHYLIRHIKTNSYMATTRLILPDIENIDEPFPVEIHSQIDKVEILEEIQRHQLAELSRFCVSKEFRRRANESESVVPNDLARKDSSERPNLMLGLFACAIRISVEHNINYWYAIMEPALHRVVKALGIPFIQIGDAVDYHGLRVPYVINVNTLLDGIAEKNIIYWKMLTNDGEYLPKTSQKPQNKTCD